MTMPMGTIEGNIRLGANFEMKGYEMNASYAGVTFSSKVPINELVIPLRIAVGFRCRWSRSLRRYRAAVGLHHVGQDRAGWRHSTDIKDQLASTDSVSAFGLGADVKVGNVRPGSMPSWSSA